MFVERVWGKLLKQTVNINLEENTLRLIDQLAVAYYNSNRSYAFEMAVFTLNQFIREKSAVPVIEEERVGWFKTVRAVKILKLEE